MVTSMPRLRDWLEYAWERFPLPVYLLLAGGLSLSGQQLGGILDLRASLLGGVGLLLFFWLLRLMDELKDYRKDLVAHPERPLPRGLLATERVAGAIRAGAWTMVGWAALTAVLAGGVAGACYLLVTAYLWLMYREFYAGTWLERRPLLYALSHQAILFAVCAYCVALPRAQGPAIGSSVLFGLLVLGAFFAYEVCRKLDPGAHPVLGTYLVAYGRARTSALVAAALLVSALAAAWLGLAVWLWPVEALLLLVLATTWVRPAAFRLAETAAGVSLLLHLWALPLRAATCDLLGWCAG